MKFIKASMPLLAGMLILGAVSCSMKQEIIVEKSGSGTVSVDIVLADYLTEVVNQVQMLLQPENPIDPEAPFFNTETIAADFAKREEVELIRLAAPTKNSLAGEFRFDDVEALFQGIEEGSPGRRLISFETSGSTSTLRIRITRETIESLLEAHPSLNNPLVAGFGPATTQGLSDRDYLDMMEFALGSESRRGIETSSLDLTVKVEGEIIEQTGGTLIDSRTVEFSVPLLPFLMLSEPLEYAVSYR